MKKESSLLVIGNILILITIIITALQIVAFDRQYYYQEYEKYNIIEETNMNIEDLKNVTMVLLDYTEGKRNDLECWVSVNGNFGQFYNEKESIHMEDVRNLYLNALFFRNCALIIGLIIYGFNIKKREIFHSSLKKALEFLVLIIGFIVIYAIVDFSSFWLNFHYLFFTNELWLLNPATDNLILLFPEEFFADLLLRILLFCGVGITIYSFIIYLLGRKNES